MLDRQPSAANDRFAAENLRVNGDASQQGLFVHGGLLLCLFRSSLLFYRISFKSSSYPASRLGWAEHYLADRKDAQRRYGEIADYLRDRRPAFLSPTDGCQ